MFIVKLFLLVRMVVFVCYIDIVYGIVEDVW